jgi:hypothetical protein
MVSDPTANDQRPTPVSRVGPASVPADSRSGARKGRPYENLTYDHRPRAGTPAWTGKLHPTGSTVPTYTS